MAEGRSVGMECGFCLSKDDQMNDPRILPCDHVHCFECLGEDFRISEILKCPLCRKVFDLTVDSLPSVTTTEDESINCDSCDREGVKEPAIIYCTVCSTKHCAKHKEQHDGLNQGHLMITLEEYRIQAKKWEPRHCTEHPTVVYSMACRYCYELTCTQCTREKHSCRMGSDHRLVKLNELVFELSKELNPLRDQVVQREEELSSLFKQTSRIISEHDTETKKLVETLHRRAGGKTEFIVLERELVELRNKAKDEITQFMDDNVGAKWFQLSNYRDRIDARLRSSHNVDILNGHSRTKEELKLLTSLKLPKLQLPSFASLQVTDTEIEIVRDFGIIDSQYGFTTRYVPKSMTVINCVNLPSQCSSVAHHCGKTYIGLYNGSVAVIDGNYQLSDALMSFKHHVFGVRVHNDILYTLVNRTQYEVYVNDLEGKPITSWTHIDSLSHHNQMSFVDNQIVLCDRENKRLTVYALNGEIVKHIPCSLITSGWTSACATDDHAVVLSSGETCSAPVFKVNISDGTVCWTSRHVTYPEGVSYYKGAVYVTNSGSTNRVWILDAKTGELLRKILDATVRPKSQGFDMCVSRKTLIVPRDGISQVIFYQLHDH